LLKTARGLRSRDTKGPAPAILSSLKQLDRHIIERKRKKGNTVETSRVHGKRQERALSGRNSITSPAKTSAGTAKGHKEKKNPRPGQKKKRLLFTAWEREEKKTRTQNPPPWEGGDCYFLHEQPTNIKTSLTEEYLVKCTAATKVARPFTPWIDTKKGAKRLPRKGEKKAPAIKIPHLETPMPTTSIASRDALRGEGVKVYARKV